MILSIIIVNYNVRDLLKECLNSVKLSSHGIKSEIYVIDNNSTDGSATMLKQYFPEVKLIENKNNIGFSKANNQALKKVRGENILILNPDTRVEKNCFRDCLEFIRNNPKCGSLGVQMSDSNGEFLQESKRGLPTPWTALCKIVGLSYLFPKSNIFNKYYLGKLNKNLNHSIEILTGAFMWIRKEALKDVEQLDESFFMYGEDIDLSYRIKKQGWENWYLGNINIVHHKGKSTNKYSYNYIKNFYGAMAIFCKKHNPKLYPFYLVIIKILTTIHSIKLFFIMLLFKK